MDSDVHLDAEGAGHGNNPSPDTIRHFAFHRSDQFSKQPCKVGSIILTIVDS